MSDDVEIVNCKIRNTMLGFEDHGIMTFMITLEGESWGQGFGGVALGGDWTDRYVRGILKALKVNEWEDLKGLYVRIKRVDRMIRAIGHITDNSWFEMIK